MNFSTNRDSIIRGIVSGLAVINMILVAFGKEQIAFADDKMYMIASAIALVVTVFIAWYKHNSTSPLGCLIRRIYDLAKKYGVEAIYEVIITALEEFLEDADEVLEEGEE